MIDATPNRRTHDEDDLETKLRDVRPNVTSRGGTRPDDTIFDTAALWTSSADPAAFDALFGAPRSHPIAPQTVRVARPRTRRRVTDAALPRAAGVATRRSESRHDTDVASDDGDSSTVCVDLAAVRELMRARESVRPEPTRGETATSTPATEPPRHPLARTVLPMAFAALVGIVVGCIAALHYVSHAHTDAAPSAPDATSARTLRAPSPPPAATP